MKRSCSKTRMTCIAVFLISTLIFAGCGLGGNAQTGANDAPKESSTDIAADTGLTADALSEDGLADKAGDKNDMSGNRSGNTLDASSGNLSDDMQSGTEAASADTLYDAYISRKELAVQALADRLEEPRENLYVYKDFSDQANHFTQRAKIYGTNGSRVMDPNENWREHPYSGSSCIRAEIQTRGIDWGGWMFMTGYLPEGESIPRLNTGYEDVRGHDLTGAVTLKFAARGEKGGEIVEFFTCGFGYDGETGIPVAPYPDSSRKHAIIVMTLSPDWQEYEINFDSGTDLSSIICGFGFVCSALYNGDADNIIYIDDIRFEGNIRSMQEGHALIRSYDTDDLVIQNTAFSYDNAVAAMAFISEGMQEEAGQILDAIVFAIENDRYRAGRVRNAYAAGIIDPIPGWKSVPIMPGWYDNDTKQWCEDQYQTGSNTGNTSFVALALLQYDAAYGKKEYVDTAAVIMDWVLENCADPTPGFTAGYDGWPEGEHPTVFNYTYKSVEHNIDAYAAFLRLYEKTGDEKYKAAADSALTFIKSMYDSERAVFCIGTGNDGITPSKENIVLDTQVWNAMSLGSEFEAFSACLERVKDMSVDGAYPFCEENENGGWWAEGTAFTALMFRERGDDERAVKALDKLCEIQDAGGLFPAATVEDLSTGISLFTGEQWVYGKEIHITPAAWFIMAVNGFDPYRFS